MKIIPVSPVCGSTLGSGYKTRAWVHVAEQSTAKRLNRAIGSMMSPRFDGQTQTLPQLHGELPLISPPRTIHHFLINTLSSPPVSSLMGLTRWIRRHRTQFRGPCRFCRSLSALVQSRQTNVCSAAAITAALMVFCETGCKRVRSTHRAAGSVSPQVSTSCCGQWHISIQFSLFT